MASDFTVQEASLDDWKRLVDLSTEHDQWPFNYDDYAVWKKAFGKDKSRFLVAKDTDDDVISFVCMGKLDPDITSIGMYYTVPKHRGKGVGMRLFDEITRDSIAEGRNLGLNGVSYMVQKYASGRGFDKCGEWNFSILNIREGADTSKIASLAGNAKVVNASEIDIAKVAAYDRTVAANIDRTQWLEAWISHPTGWNKVALNTNGSVIGYGAVRLVSLDRLVVGPLFANDKSTTAALIKALLDDDDGLATRQIQLLSPSINTDMLELLTLLSGGNCKNVGYCVSQFTKKLPNVDSSKVFAASDYALGFI